MSTPPRKSKKKIKQKSSTIEQHTTQKENGPLLHILAQVLEQLPSCSSIQI
jgi:hypothetical protein